MNNFIHFERWKCAKTKFPCVFKRGKYVINKQMKIETAWLPR
jgi:hypothetical protein